MSKVPTKRRASPELRLHIACEQFLRLAWPPHLPYSHFPAGERRDKASAGKLKAMGLKAGWPDFIFILPNAQAAFVELKAVDGRLSEDQIAFRTRAISIGCGYATVRSVEELETTLARWLERVNGPPLRATTTVRKAAPAPLLAGAEA